jgi:hypothetical protein
MKALFERLNRSRQTSSPPSPPSQQTNLTSQGNHSILVDRPAKRDGQLQLPPHQFQRQIEWALQDYEWHTGFNLVDHPLAKRFLRRTSVKDAVDILREQARHFLGGNYDSDERLMKSLNGTVCVLHKLSISTAFCQVTSLVRQRMQMGVSYL